MGGNLRHGGSRIRPEVAGRAASHLRPRRAHRDLRRVARSVQPLRPSAVCGCGGLGGAASARPVRQPAGSWAVVQFRPARGPLVCAVVRRGHPAEPHPCRGQRLDEYVGLRQPRRRAASLALRPARPARRPRFREREARRRRCPGPWTRASARRNPARSGLARQHLHLPG